MSESFWRTNNTRGFSPDQLLDRLSNNSYDEEEDYDALNDETFGEDVLTGDWEEDHEKLAELTELSRHSLANDQNGDLSAKIAAFILDDDPSPSDIELVRPIPRPPPGFNMPSAVESPDMIGLPPFKQVCTVEEIERSLLKPQVSSLRLEDLERNLMSPRMNSPAPSIHQFIPPHPSSHLAPQPPLPKIPPPIPPLVFHQPMRLPPLPPHPFLMQNNLLRSPLVGAGVPPRPPTISSVGAAVVPPHHLVAPVPLHPQLRLLQPEDEYAGLMTKWEKNWLASIQNLPFNSSNPFHDDYYYMMYHSKQSGSHSRKINSSLKFRENNTPVKHSYTPLQFENSLGKVSIGSVMAPRKIIDTEIVECVDCSTSVSSSKKIKQILLEIEQLFSNVLLAEESMSALAPPSDQPIDPQAIFNKTAKILVNGDKLKTVLNIRKGRNLVLRVLPHASFSSNLCHKLISLLPMVSKKDPEGMLRALPVIRQYLASTSLENLIQLANILEPSLVDLLSNKFGISVISNMLERAEIHLSQIDHTTEPRAQSLTDQWVEFIEKLLSTCPSAKSIERPVVGIHSAILAKHLARCSCANNQHVALLQKSLATFIAR